MHKLISYGAAIAATAALLTMTGVATAAVNTAPGQNKLQCFDGPSDGTVYGGACTVGNGAKGPATLNNSSTNPNGDYSGVYIQNSNLVGQTLPNVKQLSYTYSGTVTPMPGDLSLNLPIDTTGDGITDSYAYVDAYYCPGVDGYVDIVNDPNCGIWFMGTEYANWAAFATAFPTATITNDLPFIVAERTPGEPAAVWTINNAKFGKPGK